MEAAIDKRDIQDTGAKPAEDAPARSAKRPFMILGAIVLLAALGIGTYVFLTRNQVSTDDAQVSADVVPLAARVGGQVQAVEVPDNSEVKKGQLILVLDDSDFKARVAQAQANLATAEAQAAAADAQAKVVEATAKGGFSSAKAAVSGSTVGVSAAQAQIASAKAALLRAKADAKKAQNDLRRAQQLRAVKAIPQERLDDARIAHQAAEAQLAEAQAGLVAANEAKSAAESRVREAQGRLNQSAPIDARIAGAEAKAKLAHAKVKSAQASLILAQNQLAYTKVYAPTNGVVSKLSTYVGQLIQPGQAIAELVPDRTYVVANFKETQISRMHPGERVKIQIDAYPGADFEGKVASLSSGTGASFSLLPPDNATGNFVKVVQRVPVRIAFTEVPHGMPLRAGLSATVTVYEDSGASSAH